MNVQVAQHQASAAIARRIAMELEQIHKQAEIAGQITVEVASKWGVTLGELFGRSRGHAATAWARQELYTRLEDETSLTHDMIGVVVGRTAGTVCAGIQAHREYLRSQEGVTREGDFPPGSKPWEDHMRVAAEVAIKHGVTAQDMLGNTRKAAEAKARREAWWRIYRECRDASTPKIGAAFNRDHSTILYGIRKHEKERSHQHG